MCLIDYLRTACATLVFGLVALAIPLMASDAAIAQANAKRSADAAVTASNDMRFKRSDRVAALESIQYALSELGDGASYAVILGYKRPSLQARRRAFECRAEVQEDRGRRLPARKWGMALR